MRDRFEDETARAGPNSPIVATTTAIANAMNAKTALTPPKLSRSATTTPDKAADSRLQE